MKYNVTFFLKEPTADRETPINAHFYFQSKHWDAQKQRAKRGARYQAIINTCLDEFDLAIVAAYEELRRSRTPETLRDRLAQNHGIGQAPARRRS